ncbi:MAG TPA: 6-phosphogluconolactonase [Gemmatimonadales bacterium]|nr:6-phosphogluconolactonase [Gemmatimonadales bacterium]
MTDLILVSSPAELARQAAEWLGLEVTRAIAARGSCALALAGGRTPEPVYGELASGSSIDWNKVEVFFTDERAVPADHPDSNYRMVHWTLLSRVPISAGRIHRMEAERVDRDAAAREYERALPAQLDILVLGMGPDGHTASLFPGSPALDERHRLVVPVLGAKTPPERLTITPAVIEAARKVAVIATGEDKALMAARALEGPLAPKAVPAQLARRGIWFLDQAAAARLTHPRVTA